MDDTRPLMADPTESKDSSTTEDELVPGPVIDFATDDENGDEEEGGFLHAVDSLTNVSSAVNQEGEAASPKKRRKQKSKAPAEDSGDMEDAVVNSPNSMELEAIENVRRAADPEEDLEAASESARKRRESRKSVRWTDDLDGGELAQVTRAASYNRKELSYQPRTRLRIGNFSPLQKRILIGIGILLVILLIVVFVVVFVVIKPSSSSSPAAPTTPPISLGPFTPVTYSK